MSVSKSLDSWLLEVMILSKNELVFICDLRNLLLQIILDTWLASMSVGSNQSTAWNDSRHVPSWWFGVHFQIEDTRSTGSICIMCHQVCCHSSEHGTSSMGKHLLVKGHIAKLKSLTETELTKLRSTTVDETALAIQKR